MPQATPDLTAWPTKTEAAERIGVSIKTIERLAQERVIEVRYRPVAGRRPEPVYNPADLEREREKREPQPVVIPTTEGAPAESRAVAVRRPVQDPFAGLAEHLAKIAAAFPSQQPAVPIAQKQWLTLDEAEAYSGLSRKLLMHKITVGDIAHVRDGRGGRYKVRRRDLEAL